MDREKLIVKLYEIDTVKFGSFILKSGIPSPLYIDFRGIISEPQLMKQVAQLLSSAAKHLTFNSICGVPYTALPFATLVSTDIDKPMLIRRKEAKNYGTRKLVEGRITRGDVCLIIEDVVTTGSSVIETVQALKSEGIVVRDAIVLLDREQGGRDNLEKEGIKLHSIFTVSELLKALLKAGKIDESTDQMVTEFLKTCQLPPVVPQTDEASEILTYAERANRCTHPLNKRLFTIMETKKTNLAVAADVVDSSQLLEIAEQVGPHICVLKTHVDLLKDFSQQTADELQKLAQRHNFLIFEDRKFADIGETVREQYCGGTLTISRWSDFVTVHSLPGPGVIAGLKQAAPNKGCVIVAEMSSSGCLINEEYVKRSVKLAEQNKDFVMGFVCQTRPSSEQEFVYMSPGVHLDDVGDALGQQYRTPYNVIVDARCDVIIVGRGIRSDADPRAKAQRYKEAGYEAYTELLNSRH